MLRVVIDDDRRRFAIEDDSSVAYAIVAYAAGASSLDAVAAIARMLTEVLAIEGR